MIAGRACALRGGCLLLRCSNVPVCQLVGVVTVASGRHVLRQQHAHRTSANRTVPCHVPHAGVALGLPAITYLRTWSDVEAFLNGYPVYNSVLLLPNGDPTAQAEYFFGTILLWCNFCHRACALALSLVREPHSPKAAHCHGTNCQRSHSVHPARDVHGN